jgi:hypothetical protein
MQRHNNDNIIYYHTIVVIIAIAKINLIVCNINVVQGSTKIYLVNHFGVCLDKLN